jgi:hypothetical protein
MEQVGAGAIQSMDLVAPTKVTEEFVQKPAVQLEGTYLRAVAAFGDIYLPHLDRCIQGIV